MPSLDKMGTVILQKKITCFCYFAIGKGSGPSFEEICTPFPKSLAETDSVVLEKKM